MLLSVNVVGSGDTLTFSVDGGVSVVRLLGDTVSLNIVKGVGGETTVASVIVVGGTVNQELFSSINFFS